MSVHANYIAGSWVEGPDAAKNVNPSDLSDVVGEYAPTAPRRSRRSPRPVPRSRNGR